MTTKTTMDILASRSASLIGIFAGLLFLAACLALSTVLRGSHERFAATDPSLAGPVLGSDGVDIMEGACNVLDKDGKMVQMLKVDALHAHPNRVNSCFFSSLDEAGLMDTALTQCARGADVDDPNTVDAIGVQPVYGVPECVVKLKPGLDAAMYQKYETQLAEVAVKRTRLYKETDRQYETAKRTIELLKKQNKQAEDDLAVVAAGYNAAFTRLITAQADLVVLKAERDKRQRQVDALSGIVSLESQAALTLELEAAAKQAAYDQAERDIRALKDDIALKGGQITALQQEINTTNGMIATLQSKIEAARNAANSADSAAQTSINAANDRKRQCDAS